MRNQESFCGQPFNRYALGLRLAQFGPVARKSALSLPLRQRLARPLSNHAVFFHGQAAQ